MPRILTETKLEEFRTRICETAAELYFEMGHSGFNMRDLAGRLGVSAMTPYRYFAGKEEILGAVRARAATRLADCLEAAMPQGSSQVIQAYIDFATRETAYYRLIFDLSQPRGEQQPDLSCQERRIRSAMALAVAAGRNSSDSETLGAALWAALHGAICLVLARKMSETELSEAASELAGIFLGLRKMFVVPAIQSAGPGGVLGTTTPDTVLESTAAPMAAE